MKQLHKINPKYSFVALLTVAIFCTLTPDTAAQVVKDSVFKRPLTTRDTVPPKKDTTSRLVIISSDTTRPTQDSIAIHGDSLKMQRTDTFALKLSKDSLDAPVKYQAEDSAVVLVQEKEIILYGKTKTEYKDITLTAPKVILDQQSQTIMAVNRKDSVGNVVEEANFKQGENSFYSDSIRYNFKTQKGLTKNTMTQQTEIVIIADLTKKVSENITYLKGARFTTCMYDDPHFDIRTSKMKMISRKLAISGPAHMEFEGVPIPIYLPFGIYPITEHRHGGLLPPQFATNDQMGIGLEGLGYYFAMNDYWDLKTYGNVYSYGSWSANMNPTYRKRYHYSGAFNFGLQHTKMNFKGDPDYLSNNSFSLTWNHQADTRARPGTTFAANVNASSTTYNKYVPNSPQLNFQTLMGSSITYSKTWQGKPYNLTISANHSQNNISRLVNIDLPNVGFTVATIYPLENKEAVGEKKWYEQLGIGYNGSFRNQFSFYDSAFSIRHVLDTLQWGAQHNIPISLSLPPVMGGALLISPGLSYSQVWISQKTRLHWDDSKKKLDTVITRGIFIDQQASTSLSFSTALFGKFEFKKGRIMAIRHVMRPSISLSYQPDLSSQHYYTTQLDSSGFSSRFSEFQGALYPGYGEGKFGGVSFQVDNNLEMKLRKKTSGNSDEMADSTKMTGHDDFPRVKLIDGFGFAGSYNFFADSMNLTPISLYLRTNLFDKINITAGAVLDPYMATKRGLDSSKYAWDGDKFSPGRITSGNISISTTFKSKPRDNKKEQLKQQQIQNLKNDPTLVADQQRLLDYMRQNPAEFVDFNIPWSFSLAYSLYFQKQFKSNYSGFETKFTSSANFSGSFSLTPKWMFTMNGYYDFETQKIQMFQMSISREMHCWQLSINVTPVGPYRYFNFSISPKSGLLQDLRINRSRSFYTGY